MWCFIGVLVGNMVGVLPGMGPLATVSILLPLTLRHEPGLRDPDAGRRHLRRRSMAARSARFCSTCPATRRMRSPALDGFPMTQQGRGGRLSASRARSSFVGASFGIIRWCSLRRILVRVALQFGPAEICSVDAAGPAGRRTLARGSPLKGVAMTVVGLLLGVVGTDMNTGVDAPHLRVYELPTGSDRRSCLRPRRHRRVHLQHEPHGDGQEQDSNVRLRDMRPTGRPEAVGAADAARHDRGAYV